MDQVLSLLHAARANVEVRSLLMGAVAGLCNCTPHACYKRATCRHVSYACDICFPGTVMQRDGNYAITVDCGACQQCMLGPVNAYCTYKVHLDTV